MIWETLKEESALFVYWTIRNDRPGTKTYKIPLYRVFQKDTNIFYSGHRGHRTWHTVIFSYGDTLKVMPTNHKLQDRIRAAVQTIDGNKLVSS